MKNMSFPNKFVWGVAAASYQIEGVTLRSMNGYTNTLVYAGWLTAFKENGNV